MKILKFESFDIPDVFSDISDILRELEDEGYIIEMDVIFPKHLVRTLQKTTGSDIVTKAPRFGKRLIEVYIKKTNNYSNKTTEDLVFWKNIKETIIRIYEYVSSHDGTIRIFSDGVEWGSGWTKAEDFDGIGGDITCFRLRLLIDDIYL